MTVADITQVLEAGYKFNSRVQMRFQSPNTRENWLSLYRCKKRISVGVATVTISDGEIAGSARGFWACFVKRLTDHGETRHATPPPEKAKQVLQDALAGRPRARL